LAKRPQVPIDKDSSAVGQDARHTHRPEADDTFLPAGGWWSPQLIIFRAGCNEITSHGSLKNSQELPRLHRASCVKPLPDLK
ncbi:MAG: hypothetical protein L3J82_05660, partial [Planctomycetes bacterium]|nr:hypothetical protein [Planctomycetota bacterium]